MKRLSHKLISATLSTLRITDFVVGAIVTHSKWGVGIITAVIDEKIIMEKFGKDVRRIAVVKFG